VRKTKAIFKSAWAYQKDEMNLPIPNLEEALPFYEQIMGFQVRSKSISGLKSAVLIRDSIQIGLSENGADPSQDGCFFEVDDVEAAFTELKSNGLNKENPDYKLENHGATSWRVFFIIAPDGLCYCLGERQI
jgi:lactoylglutathione lyase